MDEIHGYWQDQENITLLRRITGFSATELRRLFLNFKSLCSLSSTPFGLTYHTFCNTIPTFTFEDLQITESWANKSVKGEEHHIHHHPFSVVSGVMFLNDTPDNLNLTFVLDVCIGNCESLRL